MIRALIVDDEFPARAELRFRLEKYADIEVVGEAASAREAMQLVNALEYDVLFLDVQMPGLSGVDLARQLRERIRSPRLVFVTAYDGYAVDAFETRAVDYLLKPFDDDRLDETVQRLREERRDSGRGAEAGSPNGGFLAWVPTEKDGKTIPVSVNDIIFVSADADRVLVHTATAQLRTRFTLQTLTERLPSRLFFRCHRSHIVNVYQVKEIIPYFNGTYLLLMKDGAHSKVPVSRGNARHLKQLFGLGV